MAKPSGGSFVGLDIGSQTIKVVEVRGAGSSLQIIAMGMEKTPPDTIQQGFVSNPKLLGTAIKSLLSKSGISSKKVVSAASGASSVVVRVIEVPRMTPAELKETMKWEVERHIPFAVNDVEMAFQPLDENVPADPNNPNMEVLLAVAQRDMVAAHLAMLEAAGLNPLVIDVEALAIGRSLINLSRSGLIAKNVAIVNIGASNTEIGVYKAGILRFPRTVPIAGDNFTQAIASQLGLSLEMAEAEKIEHATVFMDMIGASAGAGDFGSGDSGNAFPFDMSTPFDIPTTPASPFDLPPASGAAANPFQTPAATPAPANIVPDDPRTRRRRDIFEAILPQLSELSLELRRSVDYFRSRYPDSNVDQIVVAGGSSRIGNLDQFIQSDLGIPTIIANPFGGITVASRQMSVDRVSEISPSFAVAVGLAAYDAILGSGK